MFERGITIPDVKEAVQNGVIIKSYPEDKPYPSYLMLHSINNRPIHIVISMNSKSNICTIVTAYEPSPELWENDFKTKKKRK